MNVVPTLTFIQRTDITYALQLGRPILFFRDRMSKVRENFKSRGLNFDIISAPQAIQPNGLDSALYEIFVDVRYLTTLLNSTLPGPVLDVNTFLEMIISVCSRLIRYHPLQDFRQISSLDAVYHIGLIIFMMTSFLQLDGRQILKYDLVALRLKEVLDGNLDGLNDELLLWLVVMGGIWASGGSDGAWLIPRTRELAGRLRIDHWVDARRIISRLPWIKVLHDEGGCALWKQVYQGS